MNWKCHYIALLSLTLLAGCGHDSQTDAQGKGKQAAVKASSTQQDSAKAVAEAQAVVARIREAVKTNDFEAAKRHVSREMLQELRVKELRVKELRVKS